jgi:hypothetical protein
MSGLVAVFMMACWVCDQPLGLLFGWLFSLSMLVVTGRALKGADDERLAWPLAYRAATIAVVALAVGGALLATVPEAGAISDLFAVYFAVIALAAYHALIARGPRKALGVAAATQLLAVPFGFLAALASIGCRLHRESPWTDRATMLAWLGSELLALVLMAVATVAFRPHDTRVPEARVIV